jgi:hypothetical protein
MVGRRKVRQRLLIGYDGEQTEPPSCRAFQVPGVVGDIRRTNHRGWDIIANAIPLRPHNEDDQVWCVCAIALLLGQTSIAPRSLVVLPAWLKRDDTL